MYIKISEWKSFWNGRSVAVELPKLLKKIRVGVGLVKFVINEVMKHPPRLGGSNRDD